MHRRELRARVNEMLSMGIETLDYYFELHRDLETERHALHRSILHTILHRRNYSKNKRIYMLGGAPANGKSAFIRSGIVKYPENALKIDPDETKMLLPEYGYMLGIREPSAADLVHEESSCLSKKLRQAAIADGLDLLLDGIVNESLEKRIKDVEALKSNGHTIRIDYVTLDTPLSIRLAKNRYKRTGRRVPEAFIRKMSRNLAVLIPQLIDLQLFDELYLWDTNIAAKLRLILVQKKVNGK